MIRGTAATRHSVGTGGKSDNGGTVSNRTRVTRSPAERFVGAAPVP